MFDDWLPVQLELAPFIGQSVQIVFRSIRGNGVKGDMAIDDISIVEPPTIDISVNELLAPFDLECPANTNSVVVELVQKGTDTLFFDQDSLFLQAIISGPLAQVLDDTLTTGFLAPGDTTSFTFSAGVDLLTPGIYNFEIEATLINDGNSLNDSILRDVEPALLVQAPYLQDFEGGFPVGWRNVQTDGGKDWRYSQPTPAQYGPDTVDHTTGSGDYMWVDDTDPSSPNSQFWTPCIDLSTVTLPFLECWVWSENEGPNPEVLLHLDVERQGQWTDDIMPPIASQGSGWQVFRLNLDSLAGETVRFRFRAEETGTGFEHDVAIDDFRVYAGQLADMSSIQFLDLRDSLCGDVQSFGRLVVAHEGADSLSQIPIKVQVTSPLTTETLSLTLPGPLGFQQRDTLQFGPFNTSEGGLHTITAWTEWPSDGDLSNDTIRATYAYRSLEAPTLSLVGTSCSENPAVVAGPEDPLFWYAWYDTPLGGTAADTGETFTTPPVGGSLDVYAEAIGRPLTAGVPDSALGGGSPHDVFSDGLRFDVQQALVLDSLRVYPDGAGELIMNLRDSAGTLIFTDTVAMNGLTGDTLLALGWVIPEGIGYQLDAAGSNLTGLYRNLTGVNYPYTIANLLNIKAPVNGQSDFYYFFYDWRVRALGCSRPRGEITIIPEQPPQANFLQSSFRFLLVTQNLSVGADSVSWSFGDGNVSNVVNPIYTYSDTGAFELCLRAYNDCGVDSLCQIVNIICPVPVADYSFEVLNDNVVSFTDLSQGADSIWFNFGGGQGSSDSLTQFDFGNPGLVYHSIGRLSPCGQDTITQIINITETSISANRFIPISLYPNPTREAFTLQGDWPGQSKAVVSLISMRGKVVQSWEPILLGNAPQTFRLSGHTPGIYLVNIQHDWGITRYKLRIE